MAIKPNGFMPVAGTPGETPGVAEDFGDGILFREIGHTIQAVGQEIVQGGVTALRTAIARRALESPEGQAEIAATKQQELGKLLPIFIIAAVALLFIGKLFAR